MFLFAVSCSSHGSLLLVSDAIFQHPQSSVAEFISDLQPTIRLGGTHPSNSVYPQPSSRASPGSILYCLSLQNALASSGTGNTCSSIRLALIESAYLIARNNILLRDYALGFLDYFPDNV